LAVEIPQVREAAEPFVSRLFPRGTKLLRTEPLKAMVIGACSCAACRCATSSRCAKTMAPENHRAAHARGDAPIDRDLDRAGRRLRKSGWPFVVIGVLVAAPGVILITLGDGWVVGIGIALVTLALVPTIAGIGLLLSAWCPGGRLATSRSSDLRSGLRVPRASPSLGRARPILAPPDLVEDQAHEQHERDADGRQPDREHDLGVATDDQHNGAGREEREERQRMHEERSSHRVTRPAAGGGSR